MPENPRKKKRPLNKYFQLTSIATQIGVTIFFGSYLGNILDEKYSFQKPWFTILLTLLALLVSMYSVIKQLEKINSEND